MSSPIAYEMLQDHPTTLFLDVRSPLDVTPQQSRLPGVKPMPLRDLAAPATRAPIERYVEETIVVVGRDGDEGRVACETLTAAGFRSVIFLADGAAGWFAKGYPAAKNLPPPPAVAELKPGDTTPRSSLP